MTCNDDPEPYKCGAYKFAAYTVNGNQGEKPRINYCPGFFDILKPHGDVVNVINADPSGAKKTNIRNMRSQA